MRRDNTPFNGKQFILNKSTGEIHDLDRESPLCCIDEIDADNIFACDTYAEAVLFASVLGLQGTDALTVFQSITEINRPPDIPPDRVYSHTFLPPLPFLHNDNAMVHR